MRAVYAVLGAGAALVSLFFVWYTARLLFVTRFLTVTRAGGSGAYLGAVAFPIAAICAAMFARWAWRRSRVS